MTTRRAARQTTPTVVETADYARFVRRILRAYGKRVQASSLDDLGELVAMRAELDAVIAGAVTRLKDGDEAAGVPAYSWAEIGDTLGTSRQAAWQRYGAK